MKFTGCSHLLAIYPIYPQKYDTTNTEDIISKSKGWCDNNLTEVTSNEFSLWNWENLTLDQDPLEPFQLMTSSRLTAYSGEVSVTWWRILVGTSPKSSHFRLDNWRKTFPMVNQESVRLLPWMRPLKSCDQKKNAFHYNLNIINWANRAWNWGWPSRW